MNSYINLSRLNRFNHASSSRKTGILQPTIHQGLKDTMWERADHWDELLMGIGEICYKRVLSVLPREQYHSE